MDWCCTPSSSAQSLFDRLPEEMIGIIDSYLTFDDSINFIESNARVAKSLEAKFARYDELHLSDDPQECYVNCSKGNGKKRIIRDVCSSSLVQCCPSIKEVTIVVKEVDFYTRKRSSRFGEVHPFVPNGYLGTVLLPFITGFRKLSSLNVHIDMMIENFKDFYIGCPQQDLFFALNILSAAPFETFISMSLCCAEFHDSDVSARNFLISGMEQTLKGASLQGASTQFVVEPAEGYVDMTVEKGSLEYSFAFFYYNPQICETAETKRVGEVTLPRETQPLPLPNIVATNSPKVQS